MVVCVNRGVIDLNVGIHSAKSCMSISGDWRIKCMLIIWGIEYKSVFLEKTLVVNQDENTHRVKSSFISVELEETGLSEGEKI